MELYQAARNYLGVPWRHRGRSMVGIDCIGLLVLSIQDIGGTVNDRLDYGREPHRDGLQEELISQLNQVDRQPQVNDVVVARLRRNSAPVHVGIIAPYPQGLGVIHTYGDAGKVVYTRLSDKHRELITGVFEWPQE